MKKLIAAVFITLVLASMSFSTRENSTEIINVKKSEKLDIKIKNDTGEDVKVLNAGSGGSYSLTKGATTPIKMEVGDKLYHYNGGKKGVLILIASSEMDGKVQLLSKL